MLDNSLPDFRALRRASTRAKKVRTKAAQTGLEAVARRIGAKLLSSTWTAGYRVGAERRPSPGRRPSASAQARRRVDGMPTASTAFRGWVDRVRQREADAIESRNKFVQANWAWLLASRAAISTAACR